MVVCQHWNPRHSSRQYSAFSSPPIVGFTSGHFGWYWREFLGPDWVKTAEVPPLVDQFESFGERAWKLPIAKLKLMDSMPADRLQIINSEDDHVIQIQNTRFLYNWRKRGSTYPRFKILFPEFTSSLDGFRLSPDC